MTAEEAKVIAKKPGVVSVFPDPNYQLHTTHSWDFLKYQTAVKIDSGPPSSPASDGSYDTIIGLLDTGIWPESESFSDKDMGPVPSRWKGTCMEAKDFNSSNCNRLHTFFQTLTKVTTDVMLLTSFLSTVFMQKDNRSKILQKP